MDTARGWDTEARRPGSPTARLWEALVRPLDPAEAVDALLGLPTAVARQLVGTVVATCPQAEVLLHTVPRSLRHLAISTVDRPMRCYGEIRGGVMWSETLSARSASAGNPYLFVCSTPSRAYDTPENRILVAALGTVRDAGRAVDIISARSYDDDVLRRARHNGGRANRFLEHRALAAVEAARPNPRAVQRARAGTRRSIYRPALDLLQRAGEPLDAEHVAAYCDRRTAAQHALVLALAAGLEARGHPMEQFRVESGTVVAGPLRYIHPRLRQDRSRVHGVLVGDVLADVPETVGDLDRERAGVTLAARAAGHPSLPVTEPGHIADVVDLAMRHGLPERRALDDLH